MTTRDEFLRQEQQDLEMEAVREGVDKYYKTYHETPPSNRTPEMSYIARNMDPLIEHIDGVKVRVARGERMSNASVWGIPLLTVETPKLALITLTSIFNLSEKSMPRVARDISERVLMEIIHEEVKRTTPGVVSWIEKSFDHGMAYHARYALRKRAEKMMTVKWDTVTHQKVGSRLISCAYEASEDIEKCTTYTSNHRKAYSIRVKPEVKEAIEQQHSDRSVLRPSYMPLVCPPDDWTTAYDGGYLTGHDERTCLSPLIKEGFKNHISEYTPEMFGLHMAGVNYIQQTAWEVNPLIHELMQDIDVLDSELGKKLSTQPKELPCREKIDWEDPQEVAVWKYAAREIHEHNRNTQGQRSLYLYLTSTAKKMKKYPKFYFAWDLCFRGRYYPKYCGMDPQGDKINKAYLRFADPEPLGHEGYKALTIHLANCMGYDKLKESDRIQAVHDRKDEIKSWAYDPHGNTGWTEEETLLTLAAAEEWVEATESGSPETYLSKIPCAIDGKCNGLQHLSALSRDPVGAKATCLVPMDEPQDIYSLVWEKVDKYLLDTITRANLDQIPAVLPEKPKAGEQLLLTDEQRRLRKRQQDFCAALSWRDKTSRKLVKRGAMTWAYGVTRQGIMTQLIADGFLDDIEGSLAGNASYMRDLIYDAVNNTVTSAREVMEWLQYVANTAYDEGHALRWTNPAGMTIQQEYLKKKTRQVKMATGRYAFYLDDMGQRKMVRKRQVNGIAPNFVHSIDAAHMTQVSLRLKEAGVNHVHMVHDSFGVHARHVPLLHRIVREEFVKIHKRNLLQEFKEEVEEQIGAELLPYPPLGDFNVEEILESRYAFA